MQLTPAQAMNMRVVKMRNRAKTLVDNCDYYDGYKHRQSLRLERLVEACNKTLDRLSYTLQLETAAAKAKRDADDLRIIANREYNRADKLKHEIDAMREEMQRMDAVIQRQAEELAKRDLEKHEAELRGREVY